MDACTNVSINFVINLYCLKVDRNVRVQRYHDVLLKHFI